MLNYVYNYVLLYIYTAWFHIQNGKPTNDHSEDVEGKPEGKMSKVVRGGAKIAAKVTKKIVKDSGIHTCT